MDESVWKLTLDEFANRVGKGPTPAGVSICAVAASFALELLAMSLTVSARRRDFTGDRERCCHLADTARDQASQIRKYADEDIAAYQSYLKNRKTSDAAAALQAAIDVPLKIARAALHGLELCAEGSSFVSAAVAPDLASAAAILAAAARATINSAEANAASSRDDALVERLSSERLALEIEAASLLEKVLGTSVQRGS